MTPSTCARRVRIRGVVQGVGFRPHVYRAALAHQLAGWVANGTEGVEIQVEGADARVEAFLRDLETHPPPAARIAGIEVSDSRIEEHVGFRIVESRSEGQPTVRISPDLPICGACLRELFDRSDPRAGYPYINCTDCGPRFSIVLGLPYDRVRTTMAAWPLCAACAREYHDPLNRRFHAQPVACPACGPTYRLLVSAGNGDLTVRTTGGDAISTASSLLGAGAIVAVKGVGGYHLACDASNAGAVAALRERKYRKEQAFAMMVANVETARGVCELSDEAETLLRSPVRPIVLAPQRIALPGVAPDTHAFGIMLPYAPIHHLLFDAGAPRYLVMTSGNRSSEPIAFDDADALARLHGLADAFLVGERPIARRVDDSIARAGAMGPVILRRSRGLSPGAAATLPSTRPVLALGGDLKNAVVLVVGGQAYAGQHIGDLSHHDARLAFRRAIDDLMAMYRVSWDELLLVHDQHPQYVTSAIARELPAMETVAVQHHRAHVASVLAERSALDRRVVGIALDGTGYGDDGTIWGGELFVGSVIAGFERVGHLRPALLPGGDAAAKHPVQAAAGFLDDVDGLVDCASAPFLFPDRYRHARALVRGRVRTFATTSAGRLFDVFAAIAGFTRPITYEGQAAMWLEFIARSESTGREYSMTIDGTEIDWRPALQAAIDDRRSGVAPGAIARAFHRGFARALATAAIELLDRFRLDTLVLSGGVVQNDLLLSDIRDSIGTRNIHLWVNSVVPPNDGGLSLGQAALAATAGSR